MYRDLDTYFYYYIITAYHDYIAESINCSFGSHSDSRKGMECLQKLYHLREHLTRKPTCHNITRLCPEYKIIQDVNNLKKHNSPSHDSPVISNLNQIIECVIIICFEDKLGEFSSINKVVKITKDDGIEFFLHDILYKVIDFWNEYLSKNGLIVKKFDLIKPESVLVLRDRKDCQKLKLEVIQGLSFTMNAQFMKWDYEQKKAVPINLTGSKAILTIHNPALLIPSFEIINNKTGKKTNIDIVLTETDSLKFNSFKTDDERNSFIEKLDYVREQVLVKIKEDL